MVKEDKQLQLFLLLLLGGSALAALSLFNGGSAAGYMLIPAMAAMLAVWLTRRHDEKMPRLFFVAYLLISGVYLLLALINTVLQFADFDKDAGVILAFLSLFLWFFLWFEGAERRRAYGLQGARWRPQTHFISFNQFRQFFRNTWNFPFRLHAFPGQRLLSAVKLRLSPWIHRIGF